MKLSVILALVGVAFAAALPLEAPEPVSDTEDVVKAKAEFQALYEAAAAAAAAGEVPEVVIPEGAPEPVSYTDEVAAARADFQTAFDAAIANDGALPEVITPEGAPEPVADTEEVAMAKANFQAAFDAAIANDGALPEVIAPEGAPEPVADTEEVAAAKANFQAAFDAAAAAAEAAPDNDLDGAISTATGVWSPFYTNTYPFGAFGLHAPIIAGPQLVTKSIQAPIFTGTPLVSGHVITGGAPIITNSAEVETPALTYNAILPSPFGFHTPLVKFVAAEEEEEEV